MTVDSRKCVGLLKDNSLIDSLPSIVLALLHVAKKQFSEFSFKNAL